MKKLTFCFAVLASQGLMAKSITCPKGTTKSFEMFNNKIYTEHKEYYLNASHKRTSRYKVVKEAHDYWRQTDIEICKKNSTGKKHGPSRGYSQFPHDKRAQQLGHYSIPNTHHEKYWYISTNYENGKENGRRVVWPVGNYHNRLVQNIKDGKRHGLLQAIIDDATVKEETYKAGELIIEHDLIKREKKCHDANPKLNITYERDGLMSKVKFATSQSELKEYLPVVTEEALDNLIGKKTTKSCA